MRKVGYVLVVKLNKVHAVRLSTGVWLCCSGVDNCDHTRTHTHTHTHTHMYMRVHTQVVTVF